MGLHYQIHRGIAAHHAAAMRRGQRLRVNVFVGGPPAMTVAAVMPLPEGMSELTIAGVLGRRRVPMICGAAVSAVSGGGEGDSPIFAETKIGTVPQLPIYADADFCITGYLDPERLKPEGPFGDHLGYYSLAHDFPVMHVEHVYHRRDAIWPFTVVGRPPQEDTVLGQLIHDLAGPAILGHIPGIQAIHAVDAAGVHPLLLAIGSERYVPYDQRRPRELLTLANALLGYGQLSLAKYLWIVAAEDNPALDVRNVAEFPASRLGAGRLAARFALPNLHDARHARLQQRPARRRLEAGDRGGRSGGAKLAHNALRSSRAARGVGIPSAARGAAGRARRRRAAIHGDWSIFRPTNYFCG